MNPRDVDSFCTSLITFVAFDLDIKQFSFFGNVVICKSKQQEHIYQAGDYVPCFYHAMIIYSVSQKTGASGNAMF